MAENELTEMTGGRAVDVILRYTKYGVQKFCLERGGETLLQMTDQQFQIFAEDVVAMAQSYPNHLGRDPHIDCSDR